VFDELAGDFYIATLQIPIVFTAPRKCIVLNKKERSALTPTFYRVTNCTRYMRFNGCLQGKAVDFRTSFIKKKRAE